MFQTQLPPILETPRPPSQSIPPPFFRGTFPTPPDSAMKLAQQTPLESSNEDDGRLETFVSLSDDELTVEHKERLAKRALHLFACTV